MHKITFEGSPSTVFADTEGRSISGLAIPLNATAIKAGKAWKFLRDSVRFGDTTPLLGYHELNHPVGKLTKAEWSDDGLRVTFQVSKTSAGDDMLQLANDGVVGFSVGIGDVPKAKMVGDEFRVTDAFCEEISLVSRPAFVGATVDSVQLSKDEAAMPEPTIAVDVAALNETLTKVNTTLETFTNRPEAQAVPTTATVKEEAPYRFDGTKAAHVFVKDAFEGYTNGDHDSRTRIEKFLAETFVTTANVATLTPAGHRADLYVDERPLKRPLSETVSTGTLDSSNPFYVPKFNTAGSLVAPHVEGVEPGLGTFTATTQLVEPGAMSGKVEITRETIDKAGPQVEQMIWAKMVRAYYAADEARIAALIAAHVGPTAIALVGVDEVLADDLDSSFVDVDDLDRYAVLAAEPDLFKALATARDQNGRKLFSSVAPSNGDGTRTGRGTLDLDGMTAVKVAGLTDSFLIEKGAVYAWLQAPRKLTFDIQVKSVYIGLFGYQAAAVIDAAGVRKVTYAAS